MILSTVPYREVIALSPFTSSTFIFFIFLLCSFVIIVTFLLKFHAIAHFQKSKSLML